MQNDPLKGPRLKIERSHEHIRELEQIINNTFLGDVYALVVEVDPESGDRIAKIKFTGTIPDNILTRTAEICYHLRSALDQLAVALVLANGATDTTKTYFPFAGDINEFQAKGAQRKIEAMSPLAADLVRGLKPYKGGNDTLWGISRLANIDKHTKLIPVGTVGNINAARNLRVSNARYVVYITDERSLNEGVTVSNLGPSGTIGTMSSNDLQSNFEISGTVAFGDVDVFANEPILATLLNLTQLVESIITMFEQSGAFV